jgi:hypothetical protein
MGTAFGWLRVAGACNPVSMCANCRIGDVRDIFCLPISPFDVTMQLPAVPCEVKRSG